MKSKDIFALAIRLLGLVFLYFALAKVPEVMANLCAFVRNMTLGMIWSNLFAVGWPLLVAAWLLCGAPHLMRLAYPEQPGGKSEEGQESQQR